MTVLRLLFSGERHAGNYQDANSPYGKMSQGLRDAGLGITTEHYGRNLAMNIEVSDSSVLNAGIAVMFSSGVTPFSVLAPEGNGGSSDTAYKAFKAALPGHGYELKDEKLNRVAHHMLGAPLPNFMDAPIEIVKK
jgi:hypothetical protein